MFVMHLCVPAVNGPIQSGHGPSLLEPILIANFQRPTFGPGGTLALACDPVFVPDGNRHRFTDSATQMVSCTKCKATEVYKAMHAAKLAGQLPIDQAVGELPAGCC